MVSQFLRDSSARREELFVEVEGVRRHWKGTVSNEERSTKS
jgi:hypothetical protein